MHRDLAQEEILEDMINDTPHVDPPESPLIYLNPSGEGEEVHRNDQGEADGSGGGEADGSGGGKAHGEVYI